MVEVRERFKATKSWELTDSLPLYSFSVVLGGLAVGLLNFGDRIGKISAGMFTVVGASLIACETPRLTFC